MEAIFDIKPPRIDKNEIFYSESRSNFSRAVDTKVMKVRREYLMRVEKLDAKLGATYTTYAFQKG